MIVHSPLLTLSCDVSFMSIVSHARAQSQTVAPVWSAVRQRMYEARHLWRCMTECCNIADATISGQQAFHSPTVMTRHDTLSPQLEIGNNPKSIGQFLQ